MVSDEEIILKDIHELAGLWSSDRAKRLSVEDRCRRKGVKDPTKEIDIMIQSGKIISYKTARSEFIADAKGMEHQAWKP